MASPFLRTAPTPVFYKTVDTGRLVIEACLTYPVADAAGDWVRPDGGDWSAHKADPWVGLEHFRFNKARTEMLLPGEPGATEEVVRVGSAADPETGVHSVVIKAMPEGKLPFGKTYFDQHDRLSYQTFDLANRGAMDGVSLEFTLQKGRYQELGPSPLERRNAYRVDGWNGLGWVHCVRPVNPGARILKAAPAAEDIVLRVVTSGRVGDEPAHPLILKSLARFAPGKPATVRGGFTPVEMKAMDEQPADMTAAYDPAAEPDGDEGAGGFPTADALYALADAVQAACEAAEATKGEHKKGMKTLLKLCGKLDAIVQEAVAAGQNVEADLDADADVETDPTEDQAAAVDTADKDADGLMKAISERGRRLLKAVKVRRFSKAEVAAAPVAAPVPADDPADIEAARRELEKAERLLARARKIAP